jgi:hypothetical protein
MIDKMGADSDNGSVGKQFFLKDGYPSYAFLTVFKWEKPDFQMKPSASSR